MNQKKEGSHTTAFRTFGWISAEAILDFKYFFEKSCQTPSPVMMHCIRFQRAPSR